MQTSINKLMALGIPGEHANTQPFYADSYIATTDVTMGGGALASGYTHIGIFVSPHEHIKMELPSDSLSLKVAKGATVAVAKKGSWFLAVPATETASWTANAKVYVTADGVFTATESGNTEVGTIIETDGIVAAVRLG